MAPFQASQSLVRARIMCAFAPLLSGAFRHREPIVNGVLQAIVESTQIRLVVPPELDMTRLLGQGDSLLRIIEDQFESDIAVRGNQITISGHPGDSQTVSYPLVFLHPIVDQ